MTLSVGSASPMSASSVVSGPSPMSMSLVVVVPATIAVHVTLTAKRLEPENHGHGSPKSRVEAAIRQLCTPTHSMPAMISDINAWQLVCAKVSAQFPAGAPNDANAMLLIIPPGPQSSATLFPSSATLQTRVSSVIGSFVVVSVR